MAQTAPRVAIASRLFAPEPGAASQRLVGLAEALVRAGAAVDVLTSRPPASGQGDWTAPAGINVVRWPVLRDRRGQVRGYASYASFDVPLLVRLGVMRRPDVVVAEPPPTTGAAVRLATMARRLPYVYYAADVLSVAAAGIGAPRRVVSNLRRLEASVMRNATIVLSVSAGVTEESIRLGVAPDQIVDVGLGVDTTLFCPDPRPSEPPLAVYAGTMSEIHGAAVFAEAFERVAARHPDARLHYYGQGTDRSAIEARARDFGPRFQVRGPLPPAALARVLQGASVGLASAHPGRGYTFAYPTKMLPSLACGTPVIVAGDTPAAEEVRRHHLGWAVPWDVDAVAVALGQSFAGPTEAERHRLASWARDHRSIQQFADVAARHVLAVTRRQPQWPAVR